MFGFSNEYPAGHQKCQILPVFGKKSENSIVKAILLIIVNLSTALSP